MSRPQNTSRVSHYAPAIGSDANDSRQSAGEALVAAQHRWIAAVRILDCARFEVAGTSAETIEIYAARADLARAYLERAEQAAASA